MDDEKIVDLYWARSERAVAETDAKYGRYCRRVARNLLHNAEDVEECVNDTYMGAWSSMPTHRPVHLAPYLGKLTRWLALSRLRDENAVKRGGGELPVALDELAECVNSEFDTQKEVEMNELSLALGRLLDSLGDEERDIFLARYWYSASIAQIAASFKCTEGRVKTRLHRTRRKLANVLREEGLC